MRLADFYGRRIKRRTGDDPAQPGDLRPLSIIGDEMHELPATPSLLIPEVAQRAAPAASLRRGRGVPRAKPRA